MATEVIQGNIKLKDVTLARGGVSYQIANMFGELVFYEDIFSNTMSGYITVYDTTNLADRLPITAGGDTTITISLTSSEKDKQFDFKKTFYVYRMVDTIVDTTNNNNMTYRLMFASKEFIADSRKRLNCAFGDSEEKGQRLKASKIVDAICQKMLGIPASKLKIEETRYDRHLVCANWTPLQTINFLAKTDVLGFGTTNKEQDSTFVFYEDKDGYKFVSWSTLLEDRLWAGNRVIDEITLDNRNNKQNETETKRDPRIALSYVVRQNFDEIENTVNGMYSNRFIYHNLETKSFVEKKWDYVADFNKISHVEGSQAQALVDTGAKRTDRQEGKESTTLIPAEGHYQNAQDATIQWNQAEMARMAMFDNNVVEVLMTGNSGNVVGNVVTFKMFSPTEYGKDRYEYYELLSGKYLVTKIKHKIDANGYRQELELRKGVFRKRGIK